MKANQDSIAGEESSVNDNLSMEALISQLTQGEPQEVEAEEAETEVEEEEQEEGFEETETEEAF
jgi:hypothetical protein